MGEVKGVAELYAAVARIDERTENMQVEQRDIIKWQLRQDEKIGKLERHRSWIIGVGTVLVFAVTLAAKIL